MDIKFEGFDELLQELETLERKMDGEIKDEALIAAGDILLEEKQSQVYSVLQRRSGQALESLTRTDPYNDELFVGTKGGAKQPGYYLYMQEFGFFSVRAGRFIPPKPFASIAFNNVINKMLDAQVKVLRRGMGM